VTFLALILAIPQSLVNRLNTIVQKVLPQGATALQSVSHAAGLDVPYRVSRSAFLALTGKEDD